MSKTLRAEMALLSCEKCVSRLLRRILADLPIGASLYDLERPQPEQTGSFFPCLEYFLPAVLAEIHPEWSNESFDGFLPRFARKAGQREAEFFGPCVLIVDMTWIPFHLKIQIAPSDEEVSWLELSVGERGPEGMRRSKLDSKLYNRLYEFQDNPEQFDWVYKVTFGDRDLS